MILGTGSDVGKSVVAAAFCRIFRQDGHSPAPFKAQNMALNSFATPEGLEIGRAQAMQAEAAGIPCHTDMNPVLLKPTADRMCQVVLNGKPIGNRSAYDYFNGEGRDELWSAATSAFDRIAAKHSPVVLEGAGSISELNLWDRDIVNLPMAAYANAACILVADIDRGGVFGSLYGSIMLLPDHYRRLVKGIIINKFRGDIRLFEDGRKMIEELCGIPVLGVIPHFSDIKLDEEDSVMLTQKSRSAVKGKVNVAVVLLRHMSNFTDFNALEADPRINLFYASEPEQLANAAVIIIPGTKNTIADLLDLRSRGLASAIVEQQKAGKMVVGICGGYQMMGKIVSDPLGMEAGIVEVPGLAILPVSTVMEAEKVTRQVEFRFRNSDERCMGYEIHMGRTTGSGEAVNILVDGSVDGCWLPNGCYGTYMHGIFDNRVVVDALVSPFTEEESSRQSYSDFKEQEYDRLAEHFRRNVDMEKVYEIIRQ